MTKKKSSKNTADASQRKASNDKLNASLRGMYDDVVNEPVPDKMSNFDDSIDTPEG